MDHNDETPVKNPIYLVTRSAYKESLKQWGDPTLVSQGSIPMLNKTKQLTSNDESITKGYCHQPIPEAKINWVYEQVLPPIFGTQLIPRKVITKMHQINPSAFQFIVRLDDNGTQNICGILALIPLKPAATKQMLEGSLTGLTLRPEQVASARELSSYGYLALGTVVTEKIREKAASIIYTLKLMTKFSLVLSLPVTNAGLKVLDKLGFTSIEPHSETKIGLLHQWRNPRTIC